uniref:F-box protein n=1 Tax=Kalanchoe fedtschenkoi TaxID=63787 RepID=A0A7N0RBM4_KALFE
MDRGKRHVKAVSYNSKIYMDLKDIIRENALRFLPAKSLFKCTSVCRDWKLLISTPFFAHNQSFSFRGFSGLFYQTSNGLLTFVPLDSKAHGVPDPSLSFLPLPVVVRCSSNGLLCCQDSSKSYYICNPVTKQWKKLPQPNADHGADPAIVLIFEPSLLSFEAEYKLVCAFKSADFDGLEFDIFSSKEGSWRVSGEICFGNRGLLPRSGVYADGVVYWMTNMCSIFGFDLAKERSIIMHGKASMGVLNGKLCSFFFGDKELVIEVLSNAHTNTMAMNSHDPGWRKIRQIQFDVSASSAETAPADSASSDKASVFHMHKIGRGRYGHHRESVLFANHEMVVFQTEKRIVALDLKTSATTVLMTSAESTFERDARFVPYVNSLINL